MEARLIALSPEPFGRGIIKGKITDLLSDTVVLFVGLCKLLSCHCIGQLYIIR